MTVDVLRVQNPAATGLPAVNALLRRAFAAHSFVEDVDEAMDELEYWIVRPHAGLFIAREHGSWAGMAFAQWGESAFAPHMVITHVYNEGSRAVLQALLARLQDFAVEGGYDKALTLDMNDKPRAFRVLFGEGKRSVTPLGTAYRFQISEDA